MGRQYISEGSDLSYIDDGEYDFLLSCHSLEHFANPIGALMEWKRVVRPGGVILLVLPDKRYTFDIKRPYTTLEHLIEDFHRKTPEWDTTHFDEVLKLYDFRFDPINKDYSQFAALVRDNLKNRRLHHHVFSLDVLERMLNFCQIRTLTKFYLPPLHEVILGRT